MVKVVGVVYNSGQIAQREMRMDDTLLLASPSGHVSLTTAVESSGGALPRPSAQLHGSPMCISAPLAGLAVPVHRNEPMRAGNFLKQNPASVKAFRISLNGEAHVAFVCD